MSPRRKRLHYGRWKAGDKIGYFKLEDNGSTKSWGLRCHCGTLVKTVSPRTYEKRQAKYPWKPVCCRRCEADRRRDPDRSCRGCGTLDESKFRSGESVLVCMACNKAKERNGACECGRPIRYGRYGRTTTTRIACTCGATANQDEKVV